MSDGFVNPPLKRHASLQPFSRDHHLGLVRAQQLIRSASGDATQRRAAVRAFVDAWEQEIRDHFADEERLLIGLIAPGHERRLREEHAELARLAQEAPARAQSPDPQRDWTERLGKLLNDHIRWEERELFPAVETSASPETLEAIATETARVEQTRRRSGNNPRRQ
jgi:hemerythrin-like domain-containing protein